MSTLTLRPPPVPDRAEPGGALMTAIPMLGSVASVALIATMGGRGTRIYLAAGLCLVASLGIVMAQLATRRRQRRARIGAQRADYLHYLASVREQVRTAADAQRDALLREHPAPAALPVLAAEGSRLGERVPGTDGHLRVRHGVRTGPLDLELVVADAEPSATRPDPVCARALERLVAVHREVDGLPATLDLRARPCVRIGGDETTTRETTRAAARALLCSATALHRPTDLLVAVLAAPAARRHWDWTKWLPHALSPRLADAVGPRRLVATSLADLSALLPAGGPSDPHVLLVLDAAVSRPQERPGLTLVDLDADGPHDIDATAPGTDRIDTVVAQAYARRVAAHAGSRATGSTEPRGAAALLGLGDVRTLAPATAWRPRSPAERLRVPIGIDASGEPVHLDLKESAQRGMGPHGLVIGATGSGKSELLRTLVLGLAATHPPEELNLVLIDFKGGATFAGLAALPHVSAMITNLADDLTLVDRMQDALAGEMVRRQELLRAAGDLSSLADHARARRADPTIAPLPSLLIVVDEFSELLTTKPELTELFVTIGRLGRSLGLHLLLASQRLEEGRLRGLESHLSYRIGLRTFSAHESRAVLGVPDAYELPAVPGLGYLRSGPDALVRFQAAYVSGPVARPEPVRHEATGILPFGVGLVDRRDDRTIVRPRPATRTLLEVAVARLSGHGTPAHRVWLPPLGASPQLSDLVGGHPALVVPVGVVDRPHEQCRDPLLLDLRGAAGHVAVVGGPRSGKSSLLRTTVAALAVTTTPLQTQVYVIDLGGGAFAPLTGLPHVAGVATRGEPDVVRRIVAEVGVLLERREAHFRAEGIDTIEAYRALHHSGAPGAGHGAGHGDGHGDVVLVVDGWGGLRADYEELEAELQRIAERGLAYGFHLVTAAARWGDYRPALRDLLGTRIELRLGEPSDSEIDRRQAAVVPPGRPGRGLTSAGLHLLTAAPMDADALATLCARVRASWSGPPAPPLRLLPDRIDLDELLVTARVTGQTPGRGLLLGLDERDLAPVALDPDTDPHLLVLGDGRSGKSALLRTYAHEVVRTRTPRQSQLVLLDPRRSLLGALPDEHVLHHLTSPAQARPVLEELAAYLGRRLPGPEVTPTQLRARSWWQGAEVFVLVDDYDLVATPGGNPLQPLLPLLPQAADVGLHLVVARRTGGAARSLHEPVIQALRDLAAPGLLLDGDPAEGPLLGSVRPVRARPGRARLVTRERGIRVVQTAWIPDEAATYGLSDVT